jgi:hypothetical protein
MTGTARSRTAAARAGRGTRGRLSNAVLTGNSYSRPQTGAFLVDIFVRHAPKVANVTCDHSLAWITTGEVGAPLGICTQD